MQIGLLAMYEIVVNIYVAFANKSNCYVLLANKIEAAFSHWYRSPMALSPALLLSRALMLYVIF